ncbi:hypothetical protein Gasu2_31150 [Galdieria sulphuraria]|nr:hypothetical protein Gasu2_31150 [Galdieria sulphuraria]
MPKLFELTEDAFLEPKEPTAIEKFQARFEEFKEVITESDTYQRTAEIVESVTHYSKRLLRFTGNLAWIGATSALVLVVPLVYEIDKELGSSSEVGSSVEDVGGGSQPVTHSSTSSAK